MTLRFEQRGHGPLAPADHAPAVAFSQRFNVALGSGCVLALLMTLPSALRVLTTGIFLDPDDALRAVEVRDLLGGQGWFDLVQHRLSPDHPFPMHWSRLIDVPLALLVKLFALGLDPARAELAMRLVAPSLLFVAALWLMLATVRDLIGPRAMVPAALILAGSIEFVGNFVPGHIHHHAAQATLLLAATKLTLDALRTGSSRAAAGAGVAAAVSLGIGLQNLPFVIGLAAIVALAWVWMGAAKRGALAGFGAGLATTAAAVFALDVPPGLYGTGACDAFSTAHLLGCGLGGFAFVVLWQLPFRTATGRLVAAMGAGVSVIGVLALTYPACLHDPMAGVDPVLRSLWLANVGEALPLWRLISLDPWNGAALAITLVLGLAASTAALIAAKPEDRAPWAALLTLGLIGFCGTVYQVRVAPSTSAFAVPGLAWIVLSAYDRLSRTPGRPALLGAVLIGIVGNGAGTAALASTLGKLPGHAASVSPTYAVSDPTACFEPALYAALGDLPPGLVLSTIDPGSVILATTTHSVLAAPYHRNSFGNRTALLALPATPAEALPMIHAARPDYLVLCRASNETAETVALHPDSLSADLLAGRPPAWLTPIDTKGPLLSYKVALP